ncbi:TIR domain-containing protein [Cypionkella sp.]|uniref:TIR domain-containing protein n=1 Tax=Cypionkella sp. TaxID=2811411 RepID=UPI002AB938B2|nr:TIR domain-containing protein [Cypionkella sp.]MDZ4394295.1 nucleotide-binding protein [Cypionkella sp.]
MDCFNLIISGNDSQWDSEYCRFPLERLFGYTEDSIKSWLSPISSDVNQREIESYPTIIAFEESISSKARLVHLSDLRITGTDLLFRINDRQDFSTIENIYSEEMRFKLRIDVDFEKSRTHWAVKPGNALEILRNYRVGKIDASPIENSVSSNRVFVVHGHGEAELQSVARFLEKIGLQPIILKEQPDGGKTIIEKFEHHADNASYAVVILTADDLGRAVSEDTLTQRARQNVILELGYFIGALGRSRVCALKKGQIELPSDILGVLWKEIDTNGGWQLSLAKELSQAGLPVDSAKLL